MIVRTCHGWLMAGEKRDKNQVTTVLDPLIIRKLDEESERTGLSKSKVVAQWISDYFEPKPTADTVTIEQLKKEVEKLQMELKFKDETIRGLQEDKAHYIEQVGRLTALTDVLAQLSQISDRLTLLLPASKPETKSELVPSNKPETKKSRWRFWKRGEPD